MRMTSVEVLRPMNSGMCGMAFEVLDLELSLSSQDTKESLLGNSLTGKPW